MGKIYYNVADEIVCFCITEDCRQSDKYIHPGDKILVSGETISFPNSCATTQTKFSEVKQYFKRYRMPDEHKEMKAFKERAVIAAMQALIQRQDDTTEHITELAMEYAESLTNKMFE